MSSDIRRAQLVARISDLLAELDEAEKELRGHDRQFPLPPCEGPFCITIGDWLASMEPKETPVLSMLSGELRETDATHIIWKWGKP